MATCQTTSGVSMTVPAALSARASVTTTSTGYQLISSSSHYAFPRLRLTAAVSGAVVPRVKSLRIRAEEGFVEKVQKAADQASQQVKDAVSGVSKDADNVSKEAKGQGSSLGSQFEDLKDQVLGTAQDTGGDLKAKGDQSTSSVQEKLDEVASSIKSGVEDASSSASKSVEDAKAKFQK